MGTYVMYTFFFHWVVKVRKRLLLGTLVLLYHTYLRHIFLRARQRYSHRQIEMCRFNDAPLDNKFYLFIFLFHYASLEVGVFYIFYNNNMI